jgi:MFS transporter, DHA1 family, staphyloferrin A biosynthesis exporter
VSVPSPAGGRPHWFPALADPQIRAYLLGQSLSTLSTWVLEITLNLLVWQQTHSPVTLGVLNFLLYGPMVMITPVLSSRLNVANVRRIALAVLAASLAVALLLAGAALLHLLTVPLLLVAAGARGVLAGVEVPSRQMLLTYLAQDGDQLGSALAMNTVVYVVARMVGPAIAAFAFEPLGPVAAFVFSGAALGFMCGCVFRLRFAPSQAGMAEPASSGFRGALAFARQDGFASLMMPVLACLSLCANAYQTIVPVLADRAFGDAARWTAWFYAASSLGALAAAGLLSSHQAERLSRRLLMAAPWFSAIALGLIGWARSPYWAAGIFVLLGFCTSFSATATNAGLHRRGPPHARGGLIGLFLMGFTGIGPVAQLLAGALAQHLPIGQALYVLSGTLALCLLVLYGRRWLQLGRVEMDAARL